MPQTLYVNPATGNDTANGSQSTPFKTITKALGQIQPDTIIQLAPGNYNTASGEVFPLQVPSGVTILGNEGTKGNGILVEGSGGYTSPTLALQNITFLMANNAAIRGVTVTNLARRGTAVWIESTAPIVANCTFSKCNREGVLATGTANPTILNNVCLENGGNGISVTRDCGGEIRGNSCRKTGYGISIDGNAKSLVVDNTISENRFGMSISVEAKPVLRNNRIENNEEYGLAVTGNAIPDLGKSLQEPGGNILRNNGKLDILNVTKNTLVSFGNQLTASKVSGSINIDGNVVAGNPPVDTPPGGNPPGGNPPDNSGNPPDVVTPVFSDIQNHWARQFIEALSAQGMISGFKDGTFKPDDKMTRAQYAALLVKAFNPPAKRQAENFTDVPASFWGYNAIQQAYRGGFVAGFPNKTFKPNDNVQRVQVIVSLVNGLGLAVADANALNAYSDKTAIPDYAKDEVVTASKKRIVVNYPNVKQLNPTKEATRGEVAAMIYQALVDAKRVSAINSDYIVSV